MVYLTNNIKGESIIKKKNIFALVSLIILTTISSLQTQTVKADSQINNYIIQNKFQPASIEYHAGTFNVWQGYRTGVGKGLRVSSQNSEELFFRNHIKQREH